MRDDHPIDHLVVLVEGTASASIATVMQRLALDLSGRRTWVIGPPEYLDDMDPHRGRTVGLALPMYTALPPWGAELDREVDRAHLEDVKELIDEICRVSEEHGIGFDVELADEVIGAVESGQMDKLLKDGLIGEWERVVNS